MSEIGTLPLASLVKITPLLNVVGINANTAIPNANSPFQPDESERYAWCHHQNRELNQSLIPSAFLTSSVLSFNPEIRNIMKMSNDDIPCSICVCSVSIINLVTIHTEDREIVKRKKRKTIIKSVRDPVDQRERERESRDFDPFEGKNLFLLYTSSAEIFVCYVGHEI